MADAEGRPRLAQGRGPGGAGFPDAGLRGSRRDGREGGFPAGPGRADPPALGRAASPGAVRIGLDAGGLRGTGRRGGDRSRGRGPGGLREPGAGGRRLRRGRCRPLPLRPLEEGEAHRAPGQPASRRHRPDRPCGAGGTSALRRPAHGGGGGPGAAGLGVPGHLRGAEVRAPLRGSADGPRRPRGDRGRSDPDHRDPRAAGGRGEPDGDPGTDRGDDAGSWWAPRSSSSTRPTSGRSSRNPWDTGSSSARESSRGSASSGSEESWTSGTEGPGRCRIWWPFWRACA